jgi:hypothetical protein
VAGTAVAAQAPFSLEIDTGKGDPFSINVLLNNRVGERDGALAFMWYDDIEVRNDGKPRQTEHDPQAGRVVS